MNTTDQTAAPDDRAALVAQREAVGVKLTNAAALLATAERTARKLERRTPTNAAEQAALDAARRQEKSARARLDSLRGQARAIDRAIARLTDPPPRNGV